MAPEAGPEELVWLFLEEELPLGADDAVALPDTDWPEDELFCDWLADGAAVFAESSLAAGFSEMITFSDDEEEELLPEL